MISSSSVVLPACNVGPVKKNFIKSEVRPAPVISGNSTPNTFLCGNHLYAFFKFRWLKSITFTLSPRNGVAADNRLRVGVHSPPSGCPNMVFFAMVLPTTRSVSVVPIAPGFHCVAT